MSAPTQMSDSVPDVVVEVESAPGSGEYVLDEHLRADAVNLRSDEQISEATIAVRLDDDFDAISARQRYSPDCRMVVRTDEVVPAQRVMLFEGYPVEQESVRDGAPRGRKDSYRIKAAGVYSRLAQDRRTWILGRRMRNAEILDGLAADPEAYAGRSAHVEALPCVFNLDGQGNQAAEPVAVVDAHGTARRIHIFTHDGDPAATAWSLLEAVRYLVWFHHLPEGPVSVRDLLDATEAAAGVDAQDRGSFVAGSMLVERLLTSADSLNCEGTNLAEALALLADQINLHVTCVANNVDGRCASNLKLWAAEDGAEKPLGLAWGGRHADGSRRYEVSRLPARDIFCDNVLQRLELTWDHSSIVNTPLVVGDVKRWEMTVELVPGWEPEADVDNVDPGDREVAKALALTPDMVEFLGDDAELVAWYRKYHRRGSEFEDHRNVSRLWVLNEDGAFSGAIYNRNAPFDDYQPFDFSAVGDTSVTSPGRWLRCPRPMQQTITTDADGIGFGVYVEVSYDSGSTWHPVVGSVTVLKDRAGIWLGLSNPTAMVEPGGDWSEMNMWYALIDQVFRVRATAVFEADERLRACPDGDSGKTPTLWKNTRLEYKPTTYRFARRTGTVDALAEVNPDDPSIETDDGSAAEALARRIAAAEEGGRIEAEVTIPWLDESLTMGDRIGGVRGRDVILNGVLRRAHLRSADWSVVGKRYALAEGKLQTVLVLSRRTFRQ